MICVLIRKQYLSYQTLKPTLQKNADSSLSMQIQDTAVKSQSTQSRARTNFN